MKIVNRPDGGIEQYEFKLLPFNRHSHLRDLQMILQILSDLIRQYWGALVMPNLHPDVINTLERLLSYKRRIEEAIAQLEDRLRKRQFLPVMTMYLSEHMDPYEMERIFDQDLCWLIKLYFYGTTHNAQHGVKDLNHSVIRKTLKLLEQACQAKKKGALLIHGEVFDLNIDFFDLERVFIKRELPIILNEYPGLPIVLEHITTADAAACIVEYKGRVKATLTPQHLRYNRNALFRMMQAPYSVGINPTNFCLPILKAEEDRRAVLELVKTGNPNVGAGDDTAKHLDGKKFCDGGCGGCYSSLVSAEEYFRAHEECNALAHFENFMSVNFLEEIYGIKPRQGLFTVRKEEWTVPENVHGTTPFLHGQKMDIRAEIVEMAE